MLSSLSVVTTLLTIVQLDCHERVGYDCCFDIILYDFLNFVFVSGSCVSKLVEIKLNYATMQTSRPIEKLRDANIFSLICIMVL